MNVHVVLVGNRPLLMHNIRLADPLDEYALAIKQITSKPARQKTEEDQKKIGDLEFMGGIYYDAPIGPYLPNTNLKQCIREGAKKRRQGIQVQTGVVLVAERIPVLYDGPRDMKSLMADPNFRYRCAVGIGQARTFRVRPQFRNWRVEFDLLLDLDLMDFEALKEAVLKAGEVCGLGDNRPEFGLFDAIVEPIK